MRNSSSTLKGKSVVVTGGGTGIGAACAAALARAGCRVAIGGRREAPLQKVVDQVDSDPRLVFHALDVADRHSVETFFRWANETLGQIDILVQSAGVNVPKRGTAELSAEDWDRIIGVNLTGAFSCAQAVIPQMKARQDGLIINISSIAGLRAGLLGGIAYNASKFGLNAMSTTLGLELNPHGIRVTSIYPGEVETPILDARPVPVTAEHRARILQPQDVADAVLMVASLPPRANVSELLIKPTSALFC